MDDIIRYTQERNQVYRFLAVVINTLPDKTFVNNLCQLSADALVLPAQQSGDERLATGMEQVVKFCQDSQGGDKDAIAIALAVDWTRLFRGVHPGYGPPPARASAYRPYDLEQLTALYRAHGLKVQSPRFDPDYLGVQLAFMGRLVGEEERYRQQGRCGQTLAKLIGTQQLFLQEHLAWIPDFTAQAKLYADLPFYPGVLTILEGFLSVEHFWVEELIHCTEGGIT
ncbi:hypothetical protein TcarDRAFT_2233 [Thermosinus carboxydivorans Nor1]|uniref:Cytoplasmic chaperone TorD family protein n=1 Tax=Thermosinus carboxydivorans Nor1 TaxID=401526 RepID=A1HNB9_9FIRM|nr:molecular chaperone TorD family protein [Thermosinus carboxydivorans]EAX48283.1 hypothetical protein TcarDRAFT_2233 [Thermosinus carboxydivorans Nor1]